MPALISSLYSWQCNKAIQHTAKVFCDTLSSPANFWKAVWWEGRIHKLIPWHHWATLREACQLTVELPGCSLGSSPVLFFASSSRLSDNLFSKQKFQKKSWMNAELQQASWWTSSTTAAFPLFRTVQHQDEEITFSLHNDFYSSLSVL